MKTWNAGDKVLATDLNNNFLEVGKGFGGTGADGALTITSGTTYIDLGGVSHFVKNYSSISITGTGALVFTNPHPNGTVICLKSTGNVVITSSASKAISVDGMGASAGNYGLGTSGYNVYANVGGGGSISGGAIGTEATGGTQNPRTAHYALNISGKVIKFIPGGAGGNGGGGGVSDGSTMTAGPGAGGNGGGVLIIECRGSLNFTGAISANGIDGGVGGSYSSGVQGAGGHGGGGGGAGGMVAIIYNTLTENSGTITTTGGNGGNGGNGNAPGGTGNYCSGGAGGAGGSHLGYGGAGGNGGNSSGAGHNGSDGEGTGAGTYGNGGTRTNYGGGGGGGGGGSIGSSYVVLNTEF